MLLKSCFLTVLLFFIVSCKKADPTTSTPATPITNSESITVLNASFELPTAANNTFITTGPPTSWVTYGSINNSNRAVGILNPNTTSLYLDSVPQGANVGVVFLLDNAGNHAQFNNSPAGLEQTLAAALQVNSKYTLTVHVGNLNQDTPPTPYQFIGFPQYRIELLAGGVVLAQDANTLLPSEGRFLVSTISVDIPATHAQANQNLTLRLINLNSAVGIEVNFDNVILTRQF
jgi:hypothetical protein